MIKFENVTATYKKNTGVFNISFQVDSGDLVFIMGPTIKEFLHLIHKVLNLLSMELAVQFFQ